MSLTFTQEFSRFFTTEHMVFDISSVSDQFVLDNNFPLFLANTIQVFLCKPKGLIGEVF